MYVNTPILQRFRFKFIGIITRALHANRIHETLKMTLASCFH